MPLLASRGAPFVVQALLGWSACQRSLADPGARLSVAIDPEAHATIVEASSEVVDTDAAQPQAGMMRREVRPHGRVGAEAPSEATTGVLTDVEQHGDVQQQQGVSATSDQGKEALLPNHVYAMPPTQVVDLGPAPPPGHPLPGVSQGAHPAAMGTPFGAASAYGSSAVPAVSGVFRTGDGPAPSVAGARTAHPPPMYTPMSIPASASMVYPQYGPQYGAGAQAYPQYGPQYGAVAPAYMPAAPAYIPAPASFGPSGAFAPASATPCAQPASVTYVPAPVAVPAPAPVTYVPAPPVVQPAPAQVYVQPAPAPFNVQPAPVPAIQNPGVAQVVIERSEVPRPGPEAQRQVVGGSAGIVATTTESPDLRAAEQEEMVYEKFVLQAEREAGLPDTVHTTTIPYNVDLVTEEEREELDVVMLLIFGVSVIGIGGIAYMLTQQKEATKDWETKGGTQDLDNQSEQAQLQHQLRQQQSWQEQQRRLNSQRRPSQTSSQGRAAAAAQPAQEAVQPVF